MGSKGRITGTATRPRLKVLHIITSISQGGATENTILSMFGLVRSFDMSLIAGPANPGEGDVINLVRARGIPLILLPSLRRSIHPFRDVKATIDLYRAIRHGGYDIVHTHSSKAGFLGRIAARLAGVPLVIHTIHGLPFHSFQPAWLRALYIIVEKVGAACADGLISVSRTIVDVALKEGIGSREKYRVVRSGFEVSAYKQSREVRRSERKRLGIGTDDFLITKIARFSPLKGHRYLLNALPDILKEIPAARLLLVGGGELEGDIRRWIRERGLGEHVLLTGVVDPARIPRLLAASDVVVHTSLLEGLARVLPQSLATGTPVVSFDLDGAPEVVIPGTTGYLVPPGDTVSLVRAIVGVARHPRAARALARRGSELVSSSWTVSAMVDGVAGAYHEWNGLPDVVRRSARRSG